MGLLSLVTKMHPISHKVATVYGAVSALGTPVYALARRQPFS